MRRLHLYTGVLFAPAILFFALTGVVQVFNLHMARPGAAYQPPALVSRLAALHKDQTLALPRKVGPTRQLKKQDDADDSIAAGRVQPHGARLASLASILLMGFPAAAAIGFAFAAGLGLYMAYRSLVTGG